MKTVKSDPTKGEVVATGVVDVVRVMLLIRVVRVSTPGLPDDWPTPAIGTIPRSFSVVHDDDGVDNCIDHGYAEQGIQEAKVDAVPSADRSKEGR